MTVPITMEEWKAALSELSPPIDHTGKTMNELLVECGCGITTLKKRLRRAVKNGTWMQKTGLRTTISGSTVHVPVYSPTIKKTSEEKR